MARSEVVTFRPQFAYAYAELNREWIQKYFVIEPMDIAQLDKPRENIIDVGGQIFFVLEDGKPVGTCAMVPHGEFCFELAKMAVSPEMRGKGYGDLLMRHSIQWGCEKGATKIMLLSNTILETAITLYKKHGFEVVSLGPHPDYARSNIEMALKLSN